MTRGGLPALAGLELGDDPQLWASLGFALAPDATLRVGDVVLSLTGASGAAGIRSWTLRAGSPLPAQIDGIPTTTVPADAATAPGAAHPNGASGIDHVVITTPDLERTLGELDSAGFRLRRTREAGTPERPLRQAFLWAGDVLLEVAGPPRPEGDGPARLWGLVLVVPDVDALAAAHPELVGSARPAVQPGRRIASLRREAGGSVPLAFMTPHKPAGQAVESAP